MSESTQGASQGVPNVDADLLSILQRAPKQEPAQQPKQQKAETKHAPVSKRLDLLLLAKIGEDPISKRELISYAVDKGFSEQQTSLLLERLAKRGKIKCAMGKTPQGVGAMVWRT